MEIKCDVKLSCDFKCSITLRVGQDDTVKKVKEFISSQVGFAEDQQELTYIRQVMEDNMKLSEYDVLEGSIIQLRLIHNKDDNDKAAVFQRNFCKLAQGITNPATFSAKLYAARLITAEVRDYAANECSQSCTRVLRLLSAVEVQIKLFPVQNFPLFVKILCEEGCYYLLAKSLCPKLAEKYIQEGDKAQSTSVAGEELRTSESDTSVDLQPQDPLSSARFLTLEQIRHQMEEFEDKFAVLTFEFKEELETKIEDGKEKLSKVKHFVSALPHDIKSEHDRFVKTILKEKVLRKDSDIEELFYNLNIYWTFLNYSLLLYLINKFASDKLKLEMKQYDKDMKSFRQQTTVSRFVEIWGADCDDDLMSEAESKFVRVKAELNKDASHCTLEDIHLLRKDFCSAYHLSDCALVLHNLETGSVHIEWWLPVQFEVGLLSLIKRVPIEVFCISRNIERLDIGGEKVHSDMVFEEISVPEQQNLNNFLACKKCECLNEMDDHPFTHALKPGPLQYLESDCDEQLIVSFEFQSPVRLHSIQLTGPLDGCAPKSLRLFINQLHTLDFDQAQQRAAVEEIELSEDDLAHDSLIQLNFVKYQNVRNLTIFVRDNQGNKATTVIHHIGLYGNPVEWLDMSEFKRVPSCPFS